MSHDVSVVILQIFKLIFMYSKKRENGFLNLFLKKECVCLSVRNTRRVYKLISFFHRPQVDVIWHEHRCSGEMYANSLIFFSEVIFNGRN